MRVLQGTQKSDEIEDFSGYIKTLEDGWNYFDSSLVLFWIIEKSLSAYAVLDQGMLSCSGAANPSRYININILIYKIDNS